jgi:hypothetical protein
VWLTGILCIALPLPFHAKLWIAGTATLPILLGIPAAELVFLAREGRLLRVEIGSFFIDT